MTTLLATERRLYSDIWQLQEYATNSPGAKLVPLFLDMAGLTDGFRRYSVLDAGCGSGKGALALRAAGFETIRMCDLTAEGLTPEAKAAFPFSEVVLWEELTQGAYTLGGKFDYVYCCDVLEHIPPEFTMLVVRRLLDATRIGLFLNIAFGPDQFGYFVGEPLHKSVFSFTWWRDHLNMLGVVLESRDLVGSGVFLVRAK